MVRFSEDEYTQLVKNQAAIGSRPDKPLPYKCLDCETLITSGKRCAPCALVFNRQRSAERYYAEKTKFCVDCNALIGSRATRCVECAKKQHKKSQVKWRQQRDETGHVDSHAPKVHYVLNPCESCGWHPEHQGKDGKAVRIIVDERDIRWYRCLLHPERLQLWERAVVEQKEKK